MPNLALDTALVFCVLPSCKKCGVRTVPESFGTEATSYTAQLRIVCPECGKASEWFLLDNYCQSIPVIWSTLREAIADFKRDE